MHRWDNLAETSASDLHCTFSKWAKGVLGSLGLGRVFLGEGGKNRELWVWFFKQSLESRFFSPCRKEAMLTVHTR